MDIVRPDGPSGELILRGVARDIATTTGLGFEHIASASLRVRVAGESGVITDIDIEPGVGISVSDLVGAPARHLRRTLHQSAPTFSAGGSLSALLLDEIPMALLISNVGHRRSTGVGTPTNRLPALDTCAGWMTDGELARSVELPGRAVLRVGPSAPALGDGEDPHAWHEMPELPKLAVRRVRRFDLRRSQEGGRDRILIDAMLRDSYIHGDSSHRVVHEYNALVALDERARDIAAFDVVSHVLPGFECRLAASSATRLVGMPLDEIRNHVRGSFAGTSTCTHLNDVFRSVGDLASLLHIVR